MVETLKPELENVSKIISSIIEYKEETMSQQDMIEHLKSYLKIPRQCKMIIKPLWDNYFRVNFFQADTKDLVQCYKIHSSKFLKVRKLDGIIRVENLTKQEDPIKD